MIGRGLASVTGAEEFHPADATLLGAAAVLPLEIPGVSCRVVDVAARVNARRERT